MRAFPSFETLAKELMKLEKIGNFHNWRLHEELSAYDLWDCTDNWLIMENVDKKIILNWLKKVGS